MPASVLRTCLLSCLALGVATAHAQSKPAADAGATAKPAAEGAGAKKPAAEAAAPAAAAEKPAPEFTAFMKDLVGAWTCTSTFLPGAFGPGSPEVKTTSKMKFSKEAILGGFFYRGEYTVPKSKDVPMQMSGILYLGYDNAAKHFVSVFVDNMGCGGMGTGPLTETSATWTGESYMMGKKVKTRDVLTKTGPRQLTHAFEVDMGMGFQKIGENACQK